MTTNVVSAKNLILNANPVRHSCYRNMFDSCYLLVDAPTLPATTLSTKCYTSMFRNCESLRVAPELPATHLESYCYAAMFRHCYSLVESPELKADELKNNCYDGMFDGCTSIETIQCYATSGFDTYHCLYNWVKDVPQTGIFVKSSEKSDWPEGVNGIPTGWEV